MELSEIARRLIFGEEAGAIEIVRDGN